MDIDCTFTADELRDIAIALTMKIRVEDTVKKGDSRSMIIRRVAKLRTKVIDLVRDLP